MIALLLALSLLITPAGDALWLEIVSIDSGTPLEVSVKVTAKGLSRAEAT